MAVTKVEFWGHYEDEPDGSPVNCFSLRDPAGSIVVSQPDELVIKEPSIKVLIDYPLRNPVTRSLKADTDSGFTRGGLIKAIRAAYEAIYAEEEAAVGHPGQETMLYNRAESSGPYGIWGHDIDDLVLEEFTKIGDTWQCFVGS